MKAKTKTRAASYAKKLLDDIGLDDISSIEIDLLASWLDAIVIYEPLNNSDGRIIQGKRKSIIKINDSLPFSRKRFAIAHEIGHLLMHKNLEIHNENENTLNWFKQTEENMKKGKQELEANEFAVELLMPSNVFYNEAKGKPFSPQLLKQLSYKFGTSISSVALRYSQFSDLHPICVIFTSNNKVRYWSKSDDLGVWVKDITKLPPPEGSVAQEYIKYNYDFIYSGSELTQEIDKSTWFKLGYNDEDSLFYEYCIPTKSYQSVMSIIWED